MEWWRENKLRLIQTNLRETDADLDADSLIEKLKELSANALQFNTGGLMAFYPTELAWHYKSPYLKRDVVQEVLDRCHENGIRFIARFDFSKAHESICQEKPEWFYKPPGGGTVNYNGMVHTCVNGGFQSEYSLEIIREVLENYPVDGIFFNMFGYQTTDYSGHYHGICQCDNCRKEFMDFCHEELPVAEDENDPVYLDYMRFRQITTRRLLDRIHRLVKSLRPDLPISTYTDYQVDMIRKEANTAVDRPYPIWLYAASENVKSVEDTWEDKVISNCCINAADIPYRFMGVSGDLVRLRLYQSIANGSGLDFCINGVFRDYPDRANLDAVKEVFSYHQRNEQYYGCFRSAADVVLLKPCQTLLAGSREEYLGLFRMLKEQHILFDVICQENLSDRKEDLIRYRCVLVPDYRVLAEEQMEELVERLPVNWILTGRYPADHSSRLYRLIGGSLTEYMESCRAAYFLTDDKAVFARFPDRDWIFADKSFAVIWYESEQQTLLPFMRPARFGPPERCGGYECSGVSGAGIRRCGEAGIMSIPWEIGTLYQKYGYEDHKNLLMDLMDHMTGGDYRISSNAPMDTEICFHQYENGSFLLQLLNLSGYNGTTFYEPHPLYQIDISIHQTGDCNRVVRLDSGTTAEYEKQGDTLTVHVPRLERFQAYLIT